MTAFRQERVATRCQIPRDERSEGGSTRQVMLSVDSFRLAQRRIAAEFVRRVRVAIVTAADGIYEVAAQSYEHGIPPSEIQGNRCDGVPLNDSRRFGRRDTKSVVTVRRR